MRDLSSPLGVSMFDGEKPPRRWRRARRQHDRKVRRITRKRARSCRGADPRGFKECGRD